ncbi:HIT-like protein, partial [Coemansia spiralis]
IEHLLRRFQLKEVLDEDPSSKTIWLLGYISASTSDDMVVSGSKAAVVTLERLSFSAQAIGNLCVGTSNGTADSLLLSSLILDSAEHNDIYSWATGIVGATAFKPDIRVALIYPATQKHIDKHRRQQRKLIRETPELYAQVTKPYIDAQPASRIQWVYNILSKKMESERIVLEDPDPVDGFVILPDLKWDASNTNSMYLVAISQRRDIRSLRDLTQEHLPMLKNIACKAEHAAQKYGVSPDQLRLYIHYQPSYYHFHVHITNVNFEGRGMLAGRAHILDSVIHNIE